MSTETSVSATGIAGAAGVGAGGQLARVSRGTMIAISVFWFAINLHWAAVGILLVPSQVIALLLRVAPGATLADRAAWANAHEGLALAIVVAPGLFVALISNPLFGLLSDRTRGRFGRRRPYVLLGTLVNLIGLGLMAFGPLLFVTQGVGNPLAPSLLCLMGGLMLTQLSNNAAAAPFHALLPDIVPAAQRGTASGIMGLAYMFGTIAGSLVGLVFHFNSQQLFGGAQSFASYWGNIVAAYGFVAAVCLIMALITIFTVRETPWQAGHVSAEQRAASRRFWRDLALTVLATVVIVGVALLLLQVTPGLQLDANSLSVVELVAIAVAAIGAAYAFDFRPRRNPDFSWVVLTRILVMMGVYIVQNFLVYYFQNVAHASSPQGATTIFLLLLTLTATLSTFFAGYASDRMGRKRMVYISGAFMAVVGAVFILAPYLVPNGVLGLAYISAAIFGLGYGAYIAVDWALVADTLPSDATYARDMGVWNIALTLPQVFAVVFGGWLLALGILLGQPTLGYTLLFVWFVIFCALGTVTVRYIRGVVR